MYNTLKPYRLHSESDSVSFIALKRSIERLL